MHSGAQRDPIVPAQDWMRCTQPLVKWISDCRFAAMSEDVTPPPRA